MVAFEAGLLGLGGLLIMGPRVGARDEHHGVMLAAAAGILFGVCNVGVKALTGIVGADGMLGLAAQPWIVVAVAGSVAAFYASARALQDGEAVAVIAITGTAANISGIAGGIIVFGDPLPGTALGIVVQAVAFVMVDRRLGAHAGAGARRQGAPRAPPPTRGAASSRFPLSNGGAVDHPPRRRHRLALRTTNRYDRCRDSLTERTDRHG